MNLNFSLKKKKILRMIYSISMEFVRVMLFIAFLFEYMKWFAELCLMFAHRHTMHDSANPFLNLFSHFHSPGGLKYTRNVDKYQIIAD